MAVTIKGSIKRQSFFPISKLRWHGLVFYAGGIFILQGGLIPWGYGFARWYVNQDCALFLPRPLNWFVLTYDLVMARIRRYEQKIANDPQIAYRQGRADAAKEKA